MTDENEPPNLNNVIRDLRERRAQRERERQRPHRQRRGAGGGPPGLEEGPGGRPVADLANAIVAIRAEPAMALAFAYDHVAYASKVMHNYPLAPGTEPGPPPPRLREDNDIYRVQQWLQHTCGIRRLGREHVEHALDLIASERSFNPLKDELDKLEWDGEPRLAAWLSRYLGCPDDEYHRQIGSMFLIQMVKRVYEPGCQADYMIVLEGPQGEEKSKLCRALAGDEYFSDSLPPIGGDQVRVSMHLRNKWLCEVSELDAFRRAEMETLKAFITRRVEIYIPKYGRGERHEPRYCLFIGTTNTDDWIKDDTGGRRFWPVKIVQIDLSGFVEVRDQLLAEAVMGYREGKPAWPDKEFERAVIAPIQAARNPHEEWTDRVMEVLGFAEQTTIAQIWSSMGGDITKLDMIAQKRIGAILKKAGWTKTSDGRGRKAWRKS